MPKLKIATVVGARPQFIKVAAVRRAVAAHNASGHPTQLHEVLIHTGQHYDANMSDIFFQQLDLPPPNYNLEISATSHGAMTGRMLEQIETVLLKEKPDWVLVYGDTNSTLAGALAAAKLCLPLAHVEAGLRSFNRRMPEEINRILTDHCSDLLLTTHHAPTAQLTKEGVHPDKIREVGDVMCDVARHSRDKGHTNTSLLESLGVKPKKYTLVTVHRAGNTDDPHRLQQIMEGLNAIAREMPVIFPIHPRTRQALQRLPVGFTPHPSLKLIDPVGYLEMFTLESGARLIITDSGGVQKEAYFCHVPCLILRDETEWVELVQRGFSRLVESDSSAILKSFHAMLSQTFDWGADLYGSGNAAQKIIQSLLTHR